MYLGYRRGRDNRQGVDFCFGKDDEYLRGVV